MNKLDVLQQCTVEGNVVKLPSIQLERKLYQEVAKALELIGGKWKGGKVFGFVFPTDPTEMLQKIASGDNVNLKKEFQFFATPSSLAKRMVEYAKIEPLDNILEPSAGQGAIVDEILEKCTNVNHVFVCEKMPINLDILKTKYKNKRVSFLSLEDNDFLNHPEGGMLYDKIIANPPFAKNQDIDHVQKMYGLLAEGGRMVVITSKHWELSNNNKEKSFRQWLGVVGAYQEDIDAGEFKESGTNISTKLIIIDK